MRKRLLTLCFALTAVTLGAMAAEELYVAGKKVTLSGTGTVTVSGGDIMGGTVKYNRDTKTLTLSSATIARTGNNNRGIRSSVSGLTIVFSGKNIISTTSAAALRFEANTTIKGSGTVSVKSDETALYVYKNTTVIISGVDRNRLTLDLNGKYGIQGEDGISDENVVIQRYVTLTASGSDNTLKLLNNLTVSGDASVTLKGNDTNSTINDLASLTLTEGIVIDQPLKGKFYSDMKTISNSWLIIYRRDIIIRLAVLVINAKNFPDDNFRSNVKNRDQDDDGYLSNAELRDIYRFNISNNGISDLTGIEYFTALEQLYCYDNSLKSLDVSNNTALTELDCSGNSLKSLDVSNNKALTTLRCFGNQIRGAAMTNLVNSLPTRPDNDGNFIVYDYQNEGNIITPDQVKVAKDKGWAVKKLNNYGNVVNYAGEEGIAIDATNFPDDNFRKIVAAKDINTDGDNYLSVEEMDAVWMLDVENKGIADLTGVGNFWNLIALMCSGNTLTNLDVSKNTELVGLDCSNNRLTALNLSQNTVLSEVLCYGNNIKGGAMTSLVNSLHQIDDGSLCVIEEGASNDNVITKGQVEIAKKKGWNVFKKDGSNIIDYEGASFESIAINEKNFPDESFRYYLLNHTDFGKDAVLTEAEILAITELEGLEYDRGIENLKGIEYFTALTNLDCPYISLKSLDVSKNTALTWLRCWSNDIKSLDFSKNTALKELYCYYDNLQSLDVSKNAALTYLVCDYNSLKSLDVSNNTALVQLDCSDNIMKYLDVSKNTALESLDCSENSLKSLDVSKNTALKSLNCSYNSLITLDVSKNTALKSLDCSGNQIRGEAMTNLVNSLPTLPSGTEGLFYVCNDIAEIDNIITPAQVNIAKGKRWTVKKLGYNSIVNSSVMDYAGFGDVNGDGKIDQNDLDTIVKIIMGQVKLGYAGDLNMDGKTDAADIVVMVNILNGK